MTLLTFKLLNNTTMIFLISTGLLGVDYLYSEPLKIILYVHCTLVSWHHTYAGFITNIWRKVILRYRKCKSML